MQSSGRPSTRCAKCVRERHEVRKICPECGRPKDRKTFRCKRCDAAIRRLEAIHYQGPCIDCGKPKAAHSVAYRCRACAALAREDPDLTTALQAYVDAFMQFIRASPEDAPAARARMTEQVGAAGLPVAPPRRRTGRVHRDIEAVLPNLEFR